MMTLRSLLVPLAEDLNFLLTNRIPRRFATQFIGWLSKVEQPVVRDISIGIWRLFSDLDLGEAKKARFTSMHDCFTRELKDGARPIDPDPCVMVSPCDGIVGACGRIEDTRLFQVKGFPYRLSDLVCDPAFEEAYRDGIYVTLRLTVVSGDPDDARSLVLPDVTLPPGGFRQLSGVLSTAGLRNGAVAGVGEDPGVPAGVLAEIGESGRRRGYIADLEGLHHVGGIDAAHVAAVLGEEGDVPVDAGLPSSVRDRPRCPTCLGPRSLPPRCACPAPGRARRSRG